MPEWRGPRQARDLASGARRLRPRSRRDAQGAILPLLAQLRDQLLDQNLLGAKPQAQKAIADSKVQSDFLHQGIGPLKARFERLHNSRAMGGAGNGEESLRGVAQLFVQRGSQQCTGLIARKFLDPGFCHGRDVAEDFH
ncbi:MAG TPA: hypothetical protein VNR70_01740 [Steroidobacteraceae bacterium]|nr:hypothetical protein [Steroidobacteraceae bacterium]